MAFATRERRAAAVARSGATSRKAGGPRAAVTAQANASTTSGFIAVLRAASIAAAAKAGGWDRGPGSPFGFRGKCGRCSVLPGRFPKVCPLRVEPRWERPSGEVRGACQSAGHPYHGDISRSLPMGGQLLPLHILACSRCRAPMTCRPSRSVTTTCHQSPIRSASRAPARRPRSPTRSSTRCSPAASNGSRCRRRRISVVRDPRRARRRRHEEGFRIRSWVTRRGVSTFRT